MALVATRQGARTVIDELPEYLSTAPGPEPLRLGRHELWLGAQRLAAALSGAGESDADAPTPPSAARLSGRFLRLVKLPGPQLGPVLDQWWAAGAHHDAVVIGRRLRLESPLGSPARGWIMVGRIRRFTRWHWVPVVVELWPVHDKWTMMTMTPRVRVFASQRYFRTGQAVLDRLTNALAQCTEGTA